MKEGGTSRSNRYYRKHREAGLCAWCAEPSGASSLCEACKAKKKEGEQTKRSVGLCPRCGGVPEANRKICRPCLDETSAQYRARTARYRSEGKCSCGRPAAPSKKKCERCVAIGIAKSARLKRSVMEHYGGAVCACCGEREIVFLCIDHVNDDGYEHRRVIGKTASTQFYRWLKKNGFPVGFQVLCYNCNMAKRTLGGCPHRHRDTLCA